MEVNVHYFVGIQVRNQAQVGPPSEQADISDVADLYLLGAGNYQLFEQIGPAQQDGVGLGRDDSPIPPSNEQAIARHIATEQSLDVDWNDMSTGPQTQWDGMNTFMVYTILELTKNLDNESHNCWVYRIVNGKQKLSLWDFDRVCPVNQNHNVDPTDAFIRLTPRFAKIFNQCNWHKAINAFIINNAAALSDIDIVAFATSYTQSVAEIAHRKNMKQGTYTTDFNTFFPGSTYAAIYALHRQALPDFISARIQWLDQAYAPAVMTSADFKEPVAQSYVEGNAPT